jgi:hypothetical protein
MSGPGIDSDSGSGTLDFLDEVEGAGRPRVARDSLSFLDESPEFAPAQPAPQPEPPRVDPEVQRRTQAVEEWAASPDPITGGRRSRELHMPTFNIRAGSPEVTTTGEAREVVIARPGEALPADPETGARGGIAPLYDERGRVVGAVNSATGETATGSRVPSAVRSAATGVVQGLTFGFGDELMGAAGATFDWLRGDDNPNSYEDWRDAARLQTQEGRRENPVTHFAGNLVGAAAPAVLTAGASAAPSTAAAAPSLGRAIGTGALTGFTSGTVAGIGESQSDDVLGVAEDVVAGGLFGAATGGVLGAAGHGVGRLIDARRARALERIAEAEQQRPYVIARQLGVQTPTQLRTIDALPPSRLALAEASEQGVDPRTLDRGARAFAADVERLGLTGPNRMGTPQEAAQLAEPVRARATQVMDDITEAMRNASRTPASYRQNARPLGVVDGEEIAAQLQRAANDVGRARNESSAQAAEALRETAERYREGGVISFEDAVRTMRSLAQDIQQVRTNPLAPRTPFFERVAEVERAALNTATDNAVFQSLGRDAARTYQGARRDFQVADSVGRLVRDLDLKEGYRRKLSLTDNMAGLATAVGSGNPVLGVGAAIANRVFRKHEPAIFSEHLRRVIQQDPNRFGRFAQPLVDAAQRGTQSLAARHYVLSQQFPEYRQLADELEREREAETE